MEKQYFAAAEKEEAVKTLNDKAQDWFNTVQENGYIDKLKDSWLAYHGAYFGEDGHQILFSGEQGELVNLAINHYSNIAQHIINMVTATRPSFQARSTNTDYRSLVQANLANNLLEYYMREKRIERHLKAAVEYSVVLGAGYIKLGWDSMKGEIIDINEELNIPIHQGDITCSTLSPFDVVFDSTKESPDDSDWIICRSWKNKYDLAAKYPEYKKEILALETKSDLDRHIMIGKNYEETEDVAVYEFYHRRTESMANGRYLLYLNDKIVLLDSNMPYRNLPVYRISARNILGTPYGYTNMFDLIPIQEAVNSLYSSILTNQNASAVQNFWVPTGSNLTISQLYGGLNVLESHPNMKPEPLNLTHTPAEVFNFLEMLQSQMETISGINSVARGNPESGVTAGNALALLQSQALQFISGLQQSYIFLIEDVGTGLVQILQDFASVPRVAAIAGKTNKTEMKEFKGEDIKSITRVVVDVGNALSQTTAGRLQIADNLLQMGAITTVEQYFAVMNTGRLDAMTESTNNSIMLIRAENERLADGSREVLALATDNHVLHINEHSSVLADPDLRLDGDLVKRTLDHIEEHTKLLRETDPDLLAIRGQQPLGPIGGSPANQPNQQVGQVPEGETPLNMPQAAGVPADTGVLPQPAEPAPVNDPRQLK